MDKLEGWPEPQDLPFVPLVSRAQLPNVPAVYFALSANNEVLYIGKAVSLQSRWYGHHRYDQLRKFKDVRIAWLETDEHELDTLEGVMIQHYDPPLNNSLLQDAGAKPPARHCASCHQMGTVGIWTVFVCDGHGEPRLVFRDHAGRTFDGEGRVFTYGPYQVYLRVCERLDIQPVEGYTDFVYEPFEEPA